MVPFKCYSLFQTQNSSSVWALMFLLLSLTWYDDVMWCRARGLTWGRLRSLALRPWGPVTFLSGPRLMLYRDCRAAAAAWALAALLLWPHPSNSPPSTRTTMTKLLIGFPWILSVRHMYRSPGCSLLSSATGLRRSKSELLRDLLCRLVAGTKSRVSRTSLLWW